MQSIDISRFITRHQLPDSYAQLAKQWFFPLAEQLATHQKGAKKTLVIGINGAQGSGKSTLADLLVFIFEQHYQLNAVSISIDDFYYTRQQRIELAAQIHPLLLTRGVPGTHDVALAQQTLDKLTQDDKPTQVPRFNKAQDDRYPQTQWDIVASDVDIVIFEGWCLGAEAQKANDLLIPVNGLEENNDSQFIWRNYVNQQLQQHYRCLFKSIDLWVMLKAPSFDCVFDWRLQQENKLRESIDDKRKTMDERAIKQFIQYYQRITEHLLHTLPAKVDYLFELDEQRNIVHFSQPLLAQPRNNKTSNLLIFTDMDGSLLDHTTYSHAAADPLLEFLHVRNIPVIPVTSKTEAEVLFLRKALKNQHPFIIENGAAVFIPKGYFDRQPKDTKDVGDYWVKEFVKPRSHWQKLITQLDDDYSPFYISFSQLGISGIMEMTGLEHEEAVRASQRGYGEPLVWKGSEHQKRVFSEQLKMKGAQVLQGGRFMHISGCSDKGLAAQWLNAQYQLTSATHIETLAIGDSQNDVAMLEQAGIALLIRSPVQAFPVIQRHEKTYFSKKYGPEGWVDGVEKILHSLSIN